MLASVPKVFISYRREDCPGHAGRIFDRLRTQFGSDAVFMDVAGIEAGTDFVDVLQTAVGSCDALLAVIGPQWLAASHAGRRRLDDPRDFVRIEIGGALSRKVRVLPVLVDDAAMPRSEELPDDLQPLARRQAIALRDARWDADIDQLIESLTRVLGQPASGGTTASASTASGRQPRWSTGRILAIAAAAVVIVGLVLVLLRPGTSQGTPAQNRSTETLAAPLPAQPAAAPAGGSTSTAGPGSAEPAAAVADTTDPLADSPAEPAEAGPTASPPDVAARTPVRIPDVTGRMLADARTLLRAEGISVQTRYVENRTERPDVVMSQTTLRPAGTATAPVVMLNVVPSSIVTVQFTDGDDEIARQLADHLRTLPLSRGTMVRTLQVTALRAELVSLASYSDPDVAAQAASVSREASQWLTRAHPERGAVAVAENPRIVRRTVIVGLPPAKPERRR